MTTQTPTSDGAAALPAVPFLPDEATLNRLAGEFFARFPGLVPALDTSPSLGGSGSVLDAAPRYANRPPPQPGPSFAAIAPGVATAQVPPVTAPLESPIAPAPASVPTPRLSALSAPSPYYFVGGAHGYPASNGKLDGLAQQGLGQVAPDATPQRAPAHQLPISPANSQPAFYFQTELPAATQPGQRQAPAPFVLAGYEPAEVGRALNDEGLAVRQGHHCAQPILCRFGVEATVRPSFAFYNTYEEIDRMIAVVRRLAGARR